ncbi:MAG: hypothetical protein RL211_1258 [Pseudomonadota bacterium]|jgi:hypothetical protein
MIPNVFHFVFGLRKQTEPFHLMYYLCLASCIEVNQPEAVHFHYDHEPWGEWWERIKSKLVLRRIDPERSIVEYHYSNPQLNQFRYAHLADFARLRILLDEGGIYADIDTLFLRPIPTQWRARRFILGQEKSPHPAVHGGSLCNAWIACRPNDEFCRRWLDEMSKAFDGSWSNHSTLLPYRLWRQHPQLLNVEPESAFYALDWSPRGINNLFVRGVDLPANAYSLHLWSHLWFARDRTDFSLFHGGMLTVDYVRFAETTYARLARQFLPEETLGRRSLYLLQAVRSALDHPLGTARQWLHKQ